MYVDFCAESNIFGIRLFLQAFCVGGGVARTGASCGYL